MMVARGEKYPVLAVPLESRRGFLRIAYDQIISSLDDSPVLKQALTQARDIELADLREDKDDNPPHVKLVP